MATRVYFYTPDEPTDLMATVIADAAGGGKACWRKAIGPVEQLLTWCNIRSNWWVEPRGDDHGRAVNSQAAAILSAETHASRASGSGHAAAVEHAFLSCGGRYLGGHEELYVQVHPSWRSRTGHPLRYML